MNFLILSVTTGEGHNSTARAIKNELVALGATAQILDTFDYISPELAKLLQDGYLLVTGKAKEAYRIGYAIAESRSSKSTPIALINRIMSDDIAEFINADHYDAVIFTHPFAGMLTDVMKARGIIKNRTLGILTDFTFHPYWEACTHNDYVVVPDRTLLHQARAKGFRDSQILPLGIPIHPKFTESTPKKDARRLLGLDEDKPTLLLMGGSMGYGNMENVVKNIDAISDYDFQLIVVCGNNTQMQEEITALAPSCQHRLSVLGFVDYVPLLMDASDMIITKPGGLTTSEALAKGLPMIIANPIPGHEERNTEFLLNSGCAMAATKTTSVSECIFQLLSSPARLQAMRDCIAAIGKPNSTRDVSRFLFDLASTPQIGDYSEMCELGDLYIDSNGNIVRR